MQRDRDEEKWREGEESEMKKTSEKMKMKRKGERVEEGTGMKKPISLEV
jgi:hypothetical protein